VTDLQCFETDPLAAYVTDLEWYVGFLDRVTDLNGYNGFPIHVTDLECYVGFLDRVTDLNGYAGFFISRDRSRSLKTQADFGPTLQLSFFVSHGWPV